MPDGASSSTNGGGSYSPVLSTSSINPNVLNVEYAVRGELSNRANEYASILASSSSSSSPSSSPKQKGKDAGKQLKFKSVVTANIGNPQQQPFLAQKPLTFWRQVAALTEWPHLMQEESIRAANVFPEDAVKRATAILEDVGSVGAYSHSKGAHSIREHVAEFIAGE